MATKFYFSVVLEGFKKWQEGRVSLVHFFRGLLIHLGFWPCKATDEHQKISMLNVALARFLFDEANLLGAVLCPISIYTFAWTSFEDLILAVAAMFIAGMVSLMSGLLWYRSDLFDNAVTALTVMADAGSRHCVQPKAVLAENKNRASKIMLFYGAVLFVIIPVLLVFIVIYCLLTKELVIRMWYPYDYKQSPLFELTLALWVVGVTLGCHMMIVVTSLLMAFLVEASNHLQILNYNLGRIVTLTREDLAKTRKSARARQNSFSPQKRLQPEPSHGASVQENQDQSSSATAMSKGMYQNDHLTRNNEENVCVLEVKTKRAKPTSHLLVDQFQIENNIRLQANLKICLAHHQSIISYVGAIHEAFNLIILQQLICCTIPTILAIIVIVYNPGYSWMICFFGALVVICEIDLAIICWLADKVAEESVHVRDAIYSCDWFDQSDSFKRSMRIMMSRSNQPLVFKVFGFIPLTMETFYGVIKLVYTYYQSLETAVSRNRG